MKTIFLGTPELAVPFLEQLVQRTSLAAVVTSPDQPAGRGYELKAPAVKIAAQNLALPVLQPLKAKDPTFLQAIENLAPEVGIVVAYGKLLPPALLKIPKFGFLNVHFSLLPAYRGAAPIQWALINGEKESGVTLFWLDEGMDTGPIFMQRSLSIVGDTAESLRQKLVVMGVQLLAEGLEILREKGRIEKPQLGSSSKAPILTKEIGRIDWNKSAQQIVQLIAGTMPWPGAYAEWVHGGRTTRLKILQAEVITESKPGSAGTVVDLASAHGFIIKCGEGLLKVLQVQPEGKKPMKAWDYWQGARLKVGEKLI